jgi:hypothetical protein
MHLNLQVVPRKIMKEIIIIVVNDTIAENEMEAVQLTELEQGVLDQMKTKSIL